MNIRTNGISQHISNLCGHTAGRKISNQFLSHTSFSFFILQFHLSLVFLTYINLGLDAGSTYNCGRSELSIQDIFCLINLPSLLPVLILEQ